MNDVRKNLPKGLNAVDMCPNGTRFTLVDNYSDDAAHSRVISFNRICVAWDIVDMFLINPIPGPNRITPSITHQDGPEYMMLFKDEMWRYASFKGINSEPAARCEWEGVIASSGLAAWLKREISIETENKERLRELLKTSNTKLRSLVSLLTKAGAQSEKS